MIFSSFILTECSSFAQTFLAFSNLRHKTKIESKASLNDNPIEIDIQHSIERHCMAANLVYELTLLPTPDVSLHIVSVPLAAVMFSLLLVSIILRFSHSLAQARPIAVTLKVRHSYSYIHTWETPSLY